MDDLQERVAEAGARFREALDEVEAQADDLFAERQESGQNFLAILKRMREQSEWLEKRVARLLEPPPVEETASGGAEGEAEAEG